MFILSYCLWNVCSGSNAIKQTAKEFPKGSMYKEHRKLSWQLTPHMCQVLTTNLSIQRNLGVKTVIDFNFIDLKYVTEKNSYIFEQIMKLYFWGCWKNMQAKHAWHE